MSPAGSLNAATGARRPEDLFLWGDAASSGPEWWKLEPEWIREQCTFNSQCTFNLTRRQEHGRDIKLVNKVTVSIFLLVGCSVAWWRASASGCGSSRS